MEKRKESYALRDIVSYLARVLPHVLHTHICFVFNVDVERLSIWSCRPLLLCENSPFATQFSVRPALRADDASSTAFFGEMIESKALSALSIEVLIMEEICKEKMILVCGMR